MMPRVVTADEQGNVQVVDYVLPDLAEHDVRAVMLASGISHGTELHALEGGRARYPVRLGYSAVGHVTAVGPRVTRCKPDDLVFAYAPHSTVFQVKEERCWPLDNNVTPANGQFLALLGVAYNGVMEARPVLGDTVAVIGLGTVGQLVCQLARRSGAATVIGIEPYPLRREMALRNGADHALDSAAETLAETFRSLNEGRGADVVIECSGVVAGLNTAMTVAATQSDIVCLSLYRGSAEALKLGEDFHFKRLNLRVAQGNSVPRDLAHRWTHERRMRAAARLLGTLRLDGLITHRAALEDAPAAYRRLRDDAREVVQIIFESAGEPGRPAAGGR